MLGVDVSLDGSIPEHCIRDSTSKSCANLPSSINNWAIQTTTDYDTIGKICTSGDSASHMPLMVDIKTNYNTFHDYNDCLRQPSQTDCASKLTTTLKKSSSFHVSRSSPTPSLPRHPSCSNLQADSEECGDPRLRPSSRRTGKIKEGVYSQLKAFWAYVPIVRTYTRRWNTKQQQYSDLE